MGEKKRNIFEILKFWETSVYAMDAFCRKTAQLNKQLSTQDIPCKNILLFLTAAQIVWGKTPTD